MQQIIIFHFKFVETALSKIDLEFNEAKNEKIAWANQVDIEVDLTLRELNHDLVQEVANHPEIE